MRAILCLQSPFASLTLQRLRYATPDEVKTELKDLRNLFAFAPVARHVDTLRKHAKELGFNEVEFSGPLQPSPEVTLVIHPVSTGFEIARVIH